MDECVVVFVDFTLKLCLGSFFPSSLANFALWVPSRWCLLLTGSGNVCSLSLIGRTLVGATWLLSTRHLWPSKCLATEERQKSN